MYTIPNVSDQPPIVAAQAKLNQLYEQLRAARRERDQAAESTAAAVDETTRDALALLEDDGAPVAPDAKSLDHEIAVFQKAVEMQRGTVEGLVAAESLRIAETLRPTYAAIVKRGAKALTALRAFIAEEREFSHACRVADVKFSSILRPMHLGRGLDEQWVDGWLAQAKEHFGIAV